MKNVDTYKWAIVSLLQKYLHKYKDFILQNKYLLFYENSFGAKMIIALF